MRWERIAAGAGLLVWLAGAVVLAQQPPPPPQETVTAIRTKWLIDATGRAPIQDAVVVVSSGLIDAVGPRSAVQIPPGAEIIDLGDHTPLPGMIDTHSHLVLRYGSSGPGGVLGLVAQKEAPDNEQMLKIVRNARVQLLCGITTLRQTGEAHYNDILLRDAIDAGMHVGPRIISAGEGITVTGGHGADERSGLDGVDAIRKKVRENFRRGAEWIKLLQIDVTPTAGQISPEELRSTRRTGWA